MYDPSPQVSNGFLLSCYDLYLLWVLAAILKDLYLPFFQSLTDTDRKMAGKRAALKAIDWLAFAERVPPNQRAMFNNLKTRSDAIGAKYVAYPELTFRPSS